MATIFGKGHNEIKIICCNYVLIFVTLSTQANSVFRILLRDKVWYELLVSWACLLFRIVWWIVQISSFCRKFRIFADKNGAHVGLHEDEFWPFWNAEMNITTEDSKTPHCVLFPEGAEVRSFHWLAQSLFYFMDICDFIPGTILVP